MYQKDRLSQKLQQIRAALGHFTQGLQSQEAATEALCHHAAARLDGAGLELATAVHLTMLEASASCDELTAALELAVKELDEIPEAA